MYVPPGLPTIPSPLVASQPDAWTQAERALTELVNALDVDYRRPARFWRAFEVVRDQLERLDSDLARSWLYVLEVERRALHAAVAEEPENIYPVSRGTVGMVEGMRDTIEVLCGRTGC